MPLMSNKYRDHMLLVGAMRVEKYVVLILQQRGSKAENWYVLHWAYKGSPAIRPNHSNAQLYF